MSIGAWIEANPDGAIILVVDEQGRVLLPPSPPGTGVEKLPAPVPLAGVGSDHVRGSGRVLPLNPAGPATSSPSAAVSHGAAIPQRVEQEPSGSEMTAGPPVASVVVASATPDGSPTEQSPSFGVAAPLGDC